MHNRAMDVCIQVLRLRFLGEDFSVWHIRRWNLGYSGNPYIIDEVKNYKIMQSEYGNYVDITKDVLQPRTKSGLPNNCDDSGIHKDELIPDSPGERGK